MRHRGDFTDIFEALKVFPKGIADDDIVTISGKIYKWSKRRCTFVTDGVHVPQPGDSHPVITLFTSLTADGILTDFMGHKWQLAPWGDRVAVPTITVQDVTTDSEHGYPLLVGKYEAVYLVTLEHEDSEAEVWYKIIKDGNEPETFSKYYEPFIIRENGVYQIVAKAKKAGTEESVVARSERFKVTRVVVSETYSDIMVTQFKYNDVPAAGGTAKPQLAYQQAGSRVYTDGTTESITPITSGATLTFTRTGGIDPLTGDIGGIGKWSYTYRRSLGVVTLAIALNGKTATMTTEVFQSGETDKKFNEIKWVSGKNPGINRYAEGTVLTAGTDFEAYTDDNAEITYYTYVNGQRVDIVDTITVYNGTIIAAESAETEMYRSAIKEEVVYKLGIPIIYYGSRIAQTALEYIMNRDEGAILVQGTTYNHGGIEEQGDVNERIYGMADGVLWIASTVDDIGVEDMTVIISQGFAEFEIDHDSWTHLGGFIYNDRYYDVAYVPLEANATLKSITY